MNVILFGSYPRSEALVRATRGFERGVVTEEQVEAVRSQDVKNLEQLQRGFDHLSTGIFEWQDLMRPFAKLLSGCKVGGLQRFFETNTFWRVLEFDGVARVDPDLVDAWVQRYFLARGYYRPEAPLVVTLPFVGLFRQFSRGIALQEILRILTEIAGVLAGLGNKLVCFLEPSFGYRKLDAEEQRAGIELVTSLRSSSDAPLFLLTSFFAVEEQRDYLYELPVHGVGLDLYANPLEQVLHRLPSDKCLVAGVIDTSSTRVEPAEMLGQTIGRIADHLPLDRLYLSTAGPCDLLPRAVMDAKIENLRTIVQ